MLVLSRKPGEKVFVGGDIIVVVLEANSHRVRIGIEAPNHIPILRDELCRPRAPALLVKPRNARETVDAAGNP